MPEATLHIKILQGSDFKKELTLRSGGTAIDITGFTFTGQIRKSRLVTATLIGAFVFNIIDAVNGRVDMTIDSTITEGFLQGTWAYDARFDDGGADVRTFVRGNAMVIARVTT